jgi:hypothetical protein
MKIWSIAMLAMSSLIVSDACKRDPFNCKSEEVGEVFLSPESKQFFPNLTVKSMVFRSAAGTERSYAVTKKDFRAPLNVEKLCEGTNLSTHYYFMSGDVIQYEIKSATDSFQIQQAVASARLKTKKDTAFYEYIYALHLQNNAGSEVSRITSTRGNDSQISQTDKDGQIYTYVQDTILNGIPFQDVYYGRKISGTAASSKAGVFIAKGRGLIAFTDDAGVNWVKE